jgi:hypothetical protein
LLETIAVDLVFKLLLHGFLLLDEALAFFFAPSIRNLLIELLPLRLHFLS